SPSSGTGTPVTMIIIVDLTASFLPTRVANDMAIASGSSPEALETPVNSRRGALTPRAASAAIIAAIRVPTGVAPGRPGPRRQCPRYYAYRRNGYAQCACREWG